MSKKRIVGSFLCILTAIVLIAGCNHLPKPNNILQAVEQMEQARVAFGEAWESAQAIKDTPNGKILLDDLREGVKHVADAIDDLNGISDPLESCASRCKQECGGDPDSTFWCIMNCSSSDCHPSCCGCPGTYINGSCDGCKSPTDVCN